MARALDLATREGVIISQVVEDSPAEKAGIRIGDIIIGFDGVKINGPSKLQNVVSSTKPGKRSKVEIIRDGKKKTIGVVLGELSQDDQVLASRLTSNKNELGINVQELTRSLAERFNIDYDTEGVIITEVERGSRGDEAGLRPGDVIVRAGSEDITTIKEFRRLSNPEDRDILLLLVKRGNVSRYYTLDIG
ncbi:MAG: PDZ domain-containing protein [Candidatus Marinimicrobia bacterium]|nr:PDZ domain-containing protein [Candidatus Neomarinimicrobiota bacterium]